MSVATFQAIVLEQREGSVSRELRSLDEDSLPDGDLLVAVEYSGLNYKDGLAVTGRGKVVREFPIVPGIDLAGTVLESGADAFRVGDRVLVTGCGIGERYWGGWSQRARVKSAWAAHIPAALSTLRAMAFGTAGLTAMLCATALEHGGVEPGSGPVLVTGASGGVGGLATAMLAEIGYHVAASTGRKENHDYLLSLGASEILERSVLEAEAARPLESERWAGAIDSVGGATLASVLRQTRRDGVVAACGLVGGAELHTTVFPFILRGVTLAGIDSVLCPQDIRIRAWDRLARHFPLPLLDQMTTVCTLGEAPAWAERIVEGAVRGRVVIDVNHP